MSDYRSQLENPTLRRYELTPKHGGGYTPGRQGTVMDLSAPIALQVLQEALYDSTATTGGKAPSLWGYYQGKVYRFMWDGQGAWHGYPAEEKPPNAVLQQWREQGLFTEAEFGKIRRRPSRGL